MVVSKRCKICAALDTENVPISGEYFGKQIPEIIFKICGVELDPRKSNDVLICQLCVIQLMHTNVVIEKLRNAVQRLKKLRDSKLKTPSKTAAGLNKSTENIEQNYIKFGENEQNGKTPISGGRIIKKVHATKRKSMSSAIETDKNVSFVNAATDTTAVKRNKKLSKREESLTDFPVQEQISNTNNSASVEQAKEKTMNCILCDKMFHSKRTLRDHIETAHMGERLKACPHCSSEFRSQQKYQSHVFSEKCKSNNHPCQHPNCNKRFKTVHKMELHMAQKHSSQYE